jgi:hypothetical protein
MLVAVDAPHFYVGIVLVDGVEVEAAPILRWSIGKHRTFLSAYFARKGWTTTIIKEET